MSAIQLFRPTVKTIIATICVSLTMLNVVAWQRQRHYPMLKREGVHQVTRAMPKSLTEQILQNVKEEVIQKGLSLEYNSRAVTQRTGSRGRSYKSLKTSGDRKAVPVRRTQNFYDMFGDPETPNFTTTVGVSKIVASAVHTSTTISIKS